METEDAINADERCCCVTRAAELAGLKGLGLSPPGADFDSQVGQSVYRYILVLLAIDFIFLPNFPFPFLPEQVPDTPFLEERTS